MGCKFIMFMKCIRNIVGNTPIPTRETFSNTCLLSMITGHKKQTPPPMKPPKHIESNERDNKNADEESEECHTKSNTKDMIN